MSRIRMVKYVLMLCRIDSWMKHRDFKKATKVDVQALVGKIETAGYAAWTKHDYKVVIKRFWQWLHGADDDYPDHVRWIRTTIKHCNRKLPEELINDQEARQLIEAADHLRDKAFLSLMYESGCRIAEVLTLKLKHIEFDQYGALVIVKGKTGMRRIRLIQSIPHLSLWLAQHPFHEVRNSYIWTPIGTTHHTNKHVEYSAMLKRLKGIALRAGISKRIYNQLFRYSRATAHASNLTEEVMDGYFGWVPGSRMPATYVHLSCRAIDNAILKLHGIKKADSQEEKSPLQPIKCPRCLNVNPPEFKFCGRCSMVLDVQEAMKLQSLDETIAKVLGRMLKNPENRGIVDNGTKSG